MARNVTEVRTSRQSIVGTKGAPACSRRVAYQVADLRSPSHVNKFTML
jgi:hypothetical protein